MEQITIAGRLGGDAALAKTQSGDSVCNFNVAVDRREGNGKATNWYRVSLWGKRAEALAPYLLKGVSVTVSGAFSLGEYNGNPQLNVRANEIALQGGRNAQASGQQQASNSQSNAEYLDDEIPGWE